MDGEVDMGSSDHESGNREDRVFSSASGRRLRGPSPEATLSLFLPLSQKVPSLVAHMRLSFVFLRWA